MTIFRPHEQGTQAVEQVVGTHAWGALRKDRLGGLKQFAIDDRREHAIGPDPRVRAVADALLLELERDPVPDVVAGVLPVDQHLMHRAARPWSAKIGDRKSVVEGKSVSVRVDLGGRRIIKKKKENKKKNTYH